MKRLFVLLATTVFVLIAVSLLAGCSANPSSAQSYSPTIDVSPTTGTSGSELFVHAYGFKANESPITITYAGKNVDAQILNAGYKSSHISANRWGGWSAYFVATTSPAGSHIIDASGPSTLATTVPDVTFTVTPSIDIKGIEGITRTSEAAGRSVTVTGRGFSANETGITVTYNSIPIVSGISANSEGSWSVIFIAPTVNNASIPIIGVYGSTTPQMQRSPGLTVPSPPQSQDRSSYIWLIIGMIVGAAILTLILIQDRLSTTSRRYLVKGIRWTARFVGVGGILFYLFCLFAASMFGDDLIGSSAGVIFSRMTLLMAMAGCAISWWREWLAAILLIISWVTPLGVVVIGIVMGRQYDVNEWLGFGSPLLVAGLLFLLPWWFSRKASRLAPPATSV